MDLSLIPLLSLVSLIFVFKFLLRRDGRNLNLPPTPPSLPILGHLHLIREPVHQTLQKLATKYGPIMGLRFGSRPVLVVTSPSLAEECFTKNDVVLANRTQLHSKSYFEYGGKSVATTPYGNLWRDLRRVTTLEIFSSNRLKAYISVRQEEVRSLMKDLFSQDAGFTRVEMNSRVHGLSFNTNMRMIADKKIYGSDVEDTEEADKFREVIREVSKVIGSSNPQDFIPLLQWLDFQGLKKRLLRLQKETDNVAQRLIMERRRKRNMNDSSSDEESTGVRPFIDAMLSLQDSDPKYYDDDAIKANVVTLLIVGTDTTAVTIEWALSLLLNHPNVLEKARAEIDKYVGHERLVQESDLPMLPYIQCIVNETLRLFPAGPLLLPHEPSEDCKIGGFDVPRGTMVLVNAYAIQRDPKVWEEPLSFKPERFEKIGNEGQYRFIPFGMGRRQCPGVGLANRVVGLVLASLIQCFDWERVNGKELVDLTEGEGLSMPKQEPLEAMCKPRQSMVHLLKEL